MRVLHPLALATMMMASVAIVQPLHARDTQIATRAGPVGNVAAEVARQTGTSIVVVDRAIAKRRIGAIRGRMSTAEAVQRIARAANARAVQVSPLAWRLEAQPRMSQQQRSDLAASLPKGKPPPPPPPPKPDPPPEPIIVTASKRDLRLDQLPAQVTIINGELLELGGVGGTDKITRRIATVTSTHLGSGRNKLFIRGIADSSFTGPTQSTVGQYLGDMRLSYNSPDPDLRLADMASVEVLEGPQGTLYGAGSLGGIIRLVPNPPVMGEFSGSGMIGGALTQDGAPGGDANFTLNLPLTDGAAMRANLNMATLGGYIDKPLLDRRDVNRTRILGGRVGMRVELAPDWTADLIALGQTTDARDSQYVTPGGDPLESQARVGEGSNADYALGQMVISGRIGDLRIRSTTGMVRHDLGERYDASTPDGPPRLFSQENHTRMTAHETRVWRPDADGLGWLLGFSYTQNRTTLSREFETVQARRASTGVRNTIRELTLFGEGSVEILPDVTATAGGRLTHSRLGGAGEDVMPSIAMAYAAITAKRGLTRFLPSFSLSGRVTPDTTLYARYQQGFRPGGLAIESNFVRRFDSDRLTTYEVGARHGRPRIDVFDLSASLSYTRWRDIQADYIDDTGLPSTANIGDGKVWSASLAGGVALTNELRAEAGATWNYSKVDTPPVAALSDRARQVPNIAEFAGRVALAWEGDVTPDLRLTASGWASYVGQSRLGIGPQLGAPQGDYLDSGIDARLGNDRFGVTLSLDNIANSRGNRFSLGTPFGSGQDQRTPLRPRTLRLGFDATF